MKLKYIILDEIELKLLTDSNGNTQVFDNKDLAYIKADKMNGWQIIEVPFGD